VGEERSLTKKCDVAKRLLKQKTKKASSAGARKEESEGKKRWVTQFESRKTKHPGRPSEKGPSNSKETKRRSRGRFDSKVKK